MEIYAALRGVSEALLKDLQGLEITNALMMNLRSGH